MSNTEKKSTPKLIIAMICFICVAFVAGFIVGNYSEKASNAAMLNNIFRNSNINIEANATQIATEMNNTLYPMMSLFTRVILNGSMVSVASEFEGCVRVPYNGDKDLFVMNCTEVRK